MWFCRQVGWSTADGETAPELPLLLQNIVANVWSWMGHIFGISDPLLFIFGRSCFLIPVLRLPLVE